MTPASSPVPGCPVRARHSCHHRGPAPVHVGTTGAKIIDTGLMPASVNTQVAHTTVGNHRQTAAHEPAQRVLKHQQNKHKKNRFTLSTRCGPSHQGPDYLDGMGGYLPAGPPPGPQMTKLRKPCSAATTAPSVQGQVFESHYFRARELMACGHQQIDDALRCPGADPGASIPVTNRQWRLPTASSPIRIGLACRDGKLDSGDLQQDFKLQHEQAIWVRSSTVVIQIRTASTDHDYRPGTFPITGTGAGR